MKTEIRIVSGTKEVFEKEANELVDNGFETAFASLTTVSNPSGTLIFSAMFARQTKDEA